MQNHKLDFRTSLTKLNIPAIIQIKINRYINFGFSRKGYKMSLDENQKCCEIFNAITHFRDSLRCPIFLSWITDLNNGRRGVAAEKYVRSKKMPMLIVSEFDTDSESARIPQAVAWSQDFANAKIKPPPRLCLPELSPHENLCCNALNAGLKRIDDSKAVLNEEITGICGSNWRQLRAPNWWSSATPEADLAGLLGECDFILSMIDELHDFLDSCTKPGQDSNIIQTHALIEWFSESLKKAGISCEQAPSLYQRYTERAMKRKSSQFNMRDYSQFCGQEIRTGKSFECQTWFDVVLFTLQHTADFQLPLKKCARCGRYFISQNKSRFCKFKNQGTKQTCQQIFNNMKAGHESAARAYFEKKFDSNIYKKIDAYSEKHPALDPGQVRKQIRQQAKDVLLAAEKGEMSLADFKKWVDENVVLP